MDKWTDYPGPTNYSSAVSDWLCWPARFTYNVIYRLRHGWQRPANDFAAFEKRAR